MSPSSLAHLTLGYQMVWNRQRQPAAVLLSVEELDAEVPVEGAHLLRTLAQTWSGQSPTLMLAPQSARLLVDLLAHVPSDGPWIVVPQALLVHPEVAEQVTQTCQRGAQLVWRGEPGQQPDALAPSFSRSLLSLTAGAALLGLRAALHKPEPGAQAGSEPPASPVQADQIYEDVASSLLADHCLDECRAWGIAGWPSEDVLYGLRNQPIQPSRQTILRLVAATDADAALDLIELTLAEEPVLAYGFLMHANSAALGLRSPVESLRHGLMVLGLSSFKNWLLTQLQHAGNTPNLRPVRGSMVLRARLMEHLLDAGEEDKLSREVFLCGMLSQIDLVLREPLSTTIQRLPVSERVVSAVLGHGGAYAPYLEVARALELPHDQPLVELCAAHEFDLGEVNRTLIRTLAQMTPNARFAQR